jgi:hypothetical protein
MADEIIITPPEIQTINVIYNATVVEGASGYSGYSGAVGQNGASGYSGAIGPTGPQGIQGAAGISGYSGANGAVGPTGPQGIQGISGYSGAVGATGPQGIQGLAGNSGISGYSGFSGVKGEQGLQGISGYSGFSGAPSIASSGYSGYSGQDGATGAEGPTGPQGISGYSGYSGEAGATGAEGPTGPQGEQGLSGYSGYSGEAGATGAEGPTGPQGDSGYSGYSGQDGATGAEGPTGPSGPQGDQGLSGYSGYSGQDGATGAEGPTGPQGEQGISGYSGYSGATGTFSGTTSSLTVTNVLTVNSVNISNTITDIVYFYQETIVPGGAGGSGSVQILARGTALDDASDNNFTVTAEGLAVANTSTQVNLETGSFYSPGASTDYINIASGSSLALGSGPWTIDFWVYTDENATAGMKTIASQWAGSNWIIQGGDNNNTYYALGNFSTSGNGFVYFDLTPGQWNHVAIVRENNTTFKAYVDGTLVDTNTSINGPINGSGDVMLFLNNDGNQQPFPGYIQDFRITSSAVYLSNFTPPGSANDYNELVIINPASPDSIAISTASVKVSSIYFGDGTVQTTAATAGASFDQTLNTTDSVTFGGLRVNGTTRLNDILADDDTQKVVISANFTGEGSGAGGTITVGSGASDVGNKITIAATDVTIQGLTYPAADGTTGQVLKTDGAGVLGWIDQPSQPNQSLDTTSDVTFANINLQKFDETVYNWGNVAAGTVWLDVNSGTIHKMTLTGNVTMNAFTGTVATGTSVTIVMKQDATGSRTLTSSMKFAGGSKTLSTAANSVDIVSIFFDGTDYFAALTKGYA